MTVEQDVIDLLTPQALADPYPLLAELRRSRPVVWSAVHGAWLVLRYDDVVSCLQDPRLSSDRVRPVFDAKLNAEQRAQRRETFELLQDWMVFNDPPRHTRLRRLVSHAFTPRAVERLQGRIESLVDELLLGFADRDEVDLIAQYCYPLPAVVIAELMGVPSRDIERFKAWSDCVMTIVFGVAREPGVRETAQRGLVELRDYLADLVTYYRRHPAETLISELAEVAENDDQLSDDEIVSTCVLLLFGGHETTTNLIGNGTRALIVNRDQRRWLSRHPEATSAAVEELLRFDGPSKLEVRRCVADLSLRGEAISAGDQVYLLQASANRDPEAFDHPDRLDFSRTGNRHVGFGLGAHYCLGAPIARLEGRIALQRLITRYPDLAFGSAPATWHPTLVSRGMSSFPVAVRPG